LAAQDNGRSRICRSRLHLVTNRSLCPKPENANLVKAVAAAVRGGVEVVHLREHDLPAGELLALALRLREVIGEGGALVVNDRLDVAVASQADGAQLGGGSLPIAVAREFFGRKLAIGASVHGVAEALQAEKDGADYLLLGTIYLSRSHPGFAGSGPALVSEVTAKVSIPVFAIGGVQVTNIPEIMAAGARGAAVITAILVDPNPETAARRLRQAIEFGKV
jgi:thiamine-phosphate pyrophosphorylase